ncbi:MAG: ATP-binding cassette domain-containing protein [Puniceicoccaceae bacterium]|nr:MAG: ATP-binding cassette domain-containing protein [Puniceicoccaceae bacterium]
MSGNPIIEVDSLSKCYRLGQIGMTSLRDDLERLWNNLRHGTAKKEDARTFWALRDISFCVEKGQVLAVVGRNGAGKSTLLKLLSRITEPTSGRAVLRGRVASLLEVGTGFHHDLTGRENIYLNGATLGMTRREISRKFDEIVAFSGVEKFIDTPVKRYSSGMTVRLGFAVAAHLEPEIFIVDEVLAVGDIEFQRKCVGKMKDVASGGRTVLFVSHNMTSVSNLCSRGIYLRDGRLDLEGSASEIITRYMSDAVSAQSAEVFDQSTNRTGAGNVRFTDAKIELPETVGGVGLQVGDSLQMEFGIEVFGDDVGLLSFSVELGSADGLKIAHLVDRDAGFSVDRPSPGRYRIRLELPDLRLYPDRYTLGLFVGTLNGKVCYDHIPAALSFNVIEGGDVAKRNLPTTTGRIYWIPSWTFVPSV